ncbi:MAG: helix-turn-helix domain-containing protein [Betaproteobacteria bacterium]|nr:helix-turn-helix domain-containing protein [Betaproteobacteria bacterium]
MNWTSCILDLEKGGVTLSALAKEIGCPVSTLSDIKQGRTKEPRGALAIALMRRHEQHVQQNKPEAA